MTNHKRQRTNGPVLITTTYQVPVDVYAEFKHLAAQENRSARQQVRHLIENFVKDAA